MFPAGERGDPEEAAGQDWPGDEIERAYQQALDALEAAEWTNTVHGTPSPDAEESSGTAAEPPPSAPAVAPAATPAASLEPDRRERLVPRQIVEAALFVGGGPLTARKIGALLGGDSGSELVEAAVEELNAAYRDEGRPYEIRLGEGGYRLALRPEFERVRNRVFGLGPKEVKLSQDALEVLALVAYRQPITRREIEDAGKPNAGGLLRQLLRRELIALERGPEGPEDVAYRTTPRFLQVFGLARLDDLPQADELSFK